MAFHIDILPTRPKDGSPRGEWDCVEIDYTIDECISNGWLNPETGVWIRKTVEVPESDDEDDFEYEDGPWDDPSYGRNCNLNLVKVNGKWVHQEGNIFLK